MTKRGSWGDWAVIHNAPANYCGDCIHYMNDDSCAVLPVTPSILGRQAYKKCKSYTPAGLQTGIWIRCDCSYCKLYDSMKDYYCTNFDSGSYSKVCRGCDCFVDSGKGIKPIMPQKHTPAAPSKPAAIHTPVSVPVSANAEYMKYRERIIELTDKLKEAESRQAETVRNLEHENQELRNQVSSFKAHISELELKLASLSREVPLSFFRRLKYLFTGKK